MAARFSGSPSVHDKNDESYAHNRATRKRPDCIVFSNASVKRGEHLIWQHGDFAIPAGSVTAIVGTNGTGKTTMMKAELGLLPLAMAA